MSGLNDSAGQTSAEASVVGPDHQGYDLAIAQQTQGVACQRRTLATIGERVCGDEYDTSGQD
jgi:hypothetical protein